MASPQASRILTLLAAIVALVWLVSPKVAIGAGRKNLPAYYMQCSFFAGESQVFDGICRVTNRVAGLISIDTENNRGYRLRITPINGRYSFYWNGAPEGARPTLFLGEVQWSDHCWQSVAHSETPFTLCLFDQDEPK